MTYIDTEQIGWRTLQLELCIYCVYLAAIHTILY